MENDLQTGRAALTIRDFALTPGEGQSRRVKPSWDLTKLMSIFLKMLPTSGLRLFPFRGPVDARALTCLAGTAIDGHI